MKKSVCVLAVLAAAVSTSAVAKELKQKQAPTVSATQMTNSEMDKVTAGAGLWHGQGGLVNGFGRGTGAPGNGNGQGGGLLGNNNFHARF